MVSVLNSSTGLSVANIAALFGTTPASSDPDTKDGTKTSAGAASAAPITGFGAGTNAAKAIQAIVTQIQMEKIQTSGHGKSADLSFASASTTYAGMLMPAGTGFVSLDMTAVDRTASASASDTAGALGALLAQVNGRAAQIEADQDGTLVTMDEDSFGEGNFSTFLNWTGNSANITTKGFSSDAVMTGTEQGMLGEGFKNFSSRAQDFQGPSANGDGDASARASGSGTNGTALYLELSAGSDDDWSAIEAQEQQLVSAFQSGAMPGQNGKAPENGTGFNYVSQEGLYGTTYSIRGIVVSNYDPSAVTGPMANTVDYFDHRADTLDYFNHRYSGLVQSVTMGGTAVGFNNTVRQQLADIAVVIPLKNS